MLDDVQLASNKLVDTEQRKNQLKRSQTGFDIVGIKIQKSDHFMNLAHTYFKSLFVDEMDYTAFMFSHRCVSTGRSRGSLCAFRVYGEDGELCAFPLHPGSSVLAPSEIIHFFDNPRHKLPSQPYKMKVFYEQNGTVLRVETICVPTPQRHSTLAKDVVQILY